ncbi:MAG: hypothetical protein QM676_12205 [Novosphingobium sp.]
MASPPVFPRRDEALGIVAEELKRVGAPAPLPFQVEKQKRPGSGKLAWWHGGAAEERADAALLGRAYLHAYVRITGGRPLPAGGLKLHKDRVWLDRGVMSWLEREGFVAFEATGHFEPSFVLTDKGRDWIATGEV